MSSVCFFVNADQGGSTNEELDGETAEDTSAADNAQLSLQQFWATVIDDIKKVSVDHFKTQALPLARIKKIMKLDEEVKMISAEAPVLFAKAAEIFIHELTLRAWSHTEDNKRRTLQGQADTTDFHLYDSDCIVACMAKRLSKLTSCFRGKPVQRNDIAMAISKSDQFDFLIDIVPRHEVKPSKPRDDPPRANPPNDQYYLQLAQQQQQSIQTPQPQFVIQPCAQVVQQQQQQQQASSSAASTNNVVPQQPVTIVQQLVNSNGEVQQMPIQLTQAQLNMIRLQVQNNPNQPIIIQAQQQTPQIIQVTSQGQPQQQVFLAQVATSQEES